MTHEPKELDLRSHDIAEGKRQELLRLFPEIGTEGGRVIRGSLPRRALALVLEWADEHRDELMEDWKLCSRMQPPKAIEPLK